MNYLATPARMLVSRIQTAVTPATDRETGASMVEYALLIGLIAIVAVLAVTAFGDALGDKNTGIAGSIDDAIANR
ncbi:MAG: Flp family type IVb pilin [Acidimicrobiia bacterium]|nr:Flp family type IVb pilin [Acidimicrobiia bacterium]